MTAFPSYSFLRDLRRPHDLTTYLPYCIGTEIRITAAVIWIENKPFCSLCHRQTPMVATSDDVGRLAKFGNCVQHQFIGIRQGHKAQIIEIVIFYIQCNAPLHIQCSVKTISKTVSVWSFLLNIIFFPIFKLKVNSSFFFFLLNRDWHAFVLINIKKFH